MLPAGDAELLRIVDAALQDSVARSGNWLACRPGCNSCCTGVFRISQLDAERLRHGLRQLRCADPLQAHGLEIRIAASLARMGSDFPGDAYTGVLGSGADAEEAFEQFGDEEVCPVLDPVTGTCSLYAYRPMTCRTFGPPVRTEEGALGTCELCFQGASPQEVAAAELMLPAHEMEAALNAQADGHGETVVCFAFVRGV